MHCNLKNHFLTVIFPGPEASVAILTDFICAAQMAREEDCYLPEDDLKVNFLIYLMHNPIKINVSYFSTCNFSIN